LVASPTSRRPAVAIRNIGVLAMSSAGILLLAKASSGSSEAPASDGRSLYAERPGLILSSSSETRSNASFDPPPPVRQVYTCMRVPELPASKTMP